MTENDKSWYLLYCKSKEEHRALANLSNQGVNGFYPTMRMEKVIRKKLTCIDVVIFPNYLFVEMDNLHGNFNSVRSTRGVIDFVKNGNQYTKVPLQLVTELQAKQQLRDGDADTERLYNSGDKVIIKQGAFAGIEAIYNCQDGLERSMLLISLLNKPTAMSIANDEFKVQS